MPDFSELYRDQFLNFIGLYDKRVKRLFGKIARDIASLVNDPQARFVASFDFTKQTLLSKKIDAIMMEFQDEYLEMLEDEAAESWELSNQKNNKIVDRYIRNIKFLSADKAKTFFQNNIDALQVFLRSEKSFSESVWKITKQYQRELEIHLGYGILNGDSADTISRRIRQYLKNPDALFRRVRDEKGNLVLSSRAKEFNPGQGTYRSAYKNAKRLTRTVNNMAYLGADHERWQQLDFVIGVNVSLSAAHRIIDICDIFQGTYPKWFKFIGWHAQCMCNATPILMPHDDFIRQLSGESIELHYIKNVPLEFTNWVYSNTDRINGWKSIPYFIRDNFKDGKIANGLNQ